MHIPSSFCTSLVNQQRAPFQNRVSSISPHLADPLRVVLTMVFSPIHASKHDTGPPPGVAVYSVQSELSIAVGGFTSGRVILPFLRTTLRIPLVPCLTGPWGNLSTLLKKSTYSAYITALPDCPASARGHLHGGCFMRPRKHIL